MEIFQDGPDSKIFDNLVRTKLYPYQKEGIINVIKAGRVLLADDIGLGKTIQAIAAVEIFAGYFNVNKVLVICPTSLKYQWKADLVIVDEAQRIKNWKTQTAEANVVYHEDQHHTPDHQVKKLDQEIDPGSPGNRGESSEKGILSGVRNKIKRLIKRLLNSMGGIER